jgi:hypothetical protein
MPSGYLDRLAELAHITVLGMYQAPAGAPRADLRLPAGGPALGAGQHRALRRRPEERHHRVPVLLGQVNNARALFTFQNYDYVGKPLTADQCGRRVRRERHTVVRLHLPHPAQE